MSDFYPSDVTLAWKADGTPVTQIVETTRPSKQTTNKFMASFYLTLTPNQWNSHSIFICQITHDRNIVEKSMSPGECS
jgi:immunoglobulin lambda-like polypeptide 1